MGTDVRRTDPVLRRRARRLLHWYPKVWRTHYGDEFVELLVADMEERPHSLHRPLSVVRGGIVARSATLGLSGHPLEPGDAQRRSLVAVGGALSIFVVFALAMWAQLTIGWQWSPPNTEATSLAMFVMSAAIVAVAALCLAAAVPIVWSVGQRLWRRRAGNLVLPLLMSAAGIAVLAIGTHHFANGWPGTGGHAWDRQGIVPGGVAAYAWASTLFVTSYWAHPAALGGFPAPEVAWMLVSPLALAATLIGLAKVVRRLDLSPRVLRHEKRVSAAAIVAMAAFFTGAGMWVFDGGPGPRNLFHIGAIDLIDLAALALALLLSGLAVRRVGTSPATLAAD
jgi:hypothetical protein